MNIQKLRTGVIGLGEQCIDNLLPALLLSSHATITAICDIDPERLHRVSIERNIRKVYIDFKEMMDGEDLDVIVVCSFPEIHYEAAKYAIMRGIHVFVEKPPVSKTSHLHELIDLAAKMSVKTGVGMNFAYTDCHRIISDIIKEDEFGELSFISIEHVSSKPTAPLWKLDSVLDSFLLAQLIHPLDYLLSFGGAYKDLVVHSSATHSPIFVQVMIEFENSMLGCLKCGTFYPRFKHTIEIVSHKGNTISVKDLSHIEVTQKNSEAPFRLKSKNCATVYTPSPLKTGYSKAGYTSELEAFFQNILMNYKYQHSFADMMPVYETMDIIRGLLLEKFGSVHSRHNAPVGLLHSKAL